MGNDPICQVAPELYNSLRKIAKLAPNVRDFVLNRLCDEAEELLGCTVECESPIEQLMSIELEWLATTRGRRGNDCVVNRQSTVKGKHGNYRVDFLVCAQINGVLLQVAVECDGHEFHEKTKEQASRDKARDRDLLRHGTPVLRFTGSEIHRHPWKCAREVFDYLDVEAASRERMRWRDYTTQQEDEDQWPGNDSSIQNSGETLP